MSKPKLLDLFSGAGGAAEGYARAGFEVYGVDIAAQPRYPQWFRRCDVLEMKPYLFAEEYDAIHASPPCQAYSDLAHRTGRSYPDLISRVRALLKATGLPYVIENVEGAPLLSPVMLCGTMFGLRVLRHRLFETSFPLIAPPHGEHPLVYTTDKRKAHYGHLDQASSFVSVNGGGNSSVAQARLAMGIPWMTKAELNEAIPPTYTEWIGRQLLAVLTKEAA